MTKANGRDDETERDALPNTSHYFKADNMLWANRKLQSLPGAQFKFYWNCLSLAAPRGGVLPEPVDISFKLRIRLSKCTRFIQIMIEKRFFERKSDHDQTLIVHDFLGWQSSQSADAIRKRRERAEKKYRQQNPDASGTRPIYNRIKYNRGGSKTPTVDNRWKPSGRTPPKR